MDSWVVKWDFTSRFSLFIFPRSPLPLSSNPTFRHVPPQVGGLGDNEDDPSVVTRSG